MIMKLIVRMRLILILTLMLISAALEYRFENNVFKTGVFIFNSLITQFTAYA